MTNGLPGTIKKALEQGVLRVGRLKKAEKIKEIDRQLEELMMESNVVAGRGPAFDAEAGPGPLTAIALAVGRVFQPTRKDSRMIDEQLSQVIVESGGMADYKVEHAAGSPKAMPGGQQEIKEVVNDVKVFAVKYKEAINGKGASNNAAGKPEAPPVAVSPAGRGMDLPKAEAPPAGLDFGDDLMSKLAETTAVKKDVTLDIMRDMKGSRIDCDELQAGLEEISALFSKAAKRKQKKTGG